MRGVALLAFAGGNALQAFAAEHLHEYDAHWDDFKEIHGKEYESQEVRMGLELYFGAPCPPRAVAVGRGKCDIEYWTVDLIWPI